MDLKIVILGDEAVGKSSLLAEKFSPYTKITCEPDIKSRQFTIDNQIVNVKVLVLICELLKCYLNFILIMFCNFSIFGFLN